MKLPNKLSKKVVIIFGIFLIISFGIYFSLNQAFTIHENLANNYVISTGNGALVMSCDHNENMNSNQISQGYISIDDTNLESFVLSTQPFAWSHKRCNGVGTAITKYYIWNYNTSSWELFSDITTSHGYSYMSAGTWWVNLNENEQFKLMKGRDYAFDQVEYQYYCKAGVVLGDLPDCHTQTRSDDEGDVCKNTCVFEGGQFNKVDYDNGGSYGTSYERYAHDSVKTIFNADYSLAGIVKIKTDVLVTGAIEVSVATLSRVSVQNIVKFEAPIEYFRFTNNDCNSINLLLADVTVNDYTTLVECQTLIQEIIETPETLDGSDSSGGSTTSETSETSETQDTTLYNREERKSWWKRLFSKDVSIENSIAKIEEFKYYNEVKISENNYEYLGKVYNKNNVDELEKLKNIMFEEEMKDYNIFTRFFKRLFR